MKHVNAAKHRSHFEVVAQGASSQAAMMTLRPGQSSGADVENEHPRAEQWVYVIRGAGTARVGRRSVALRQGSLLLIEKGEPHRITNTGKVPLVTLNCYAPPAYTANEEVRPAVKRKRG
jgi:mannose-6-phosphate isomerase-like protein (cupin superfamily)